MPRTKPITIIITDQYPVVRAGLRALFLRHRNLRVVGEAANGREAVRLAMSLNPDVVITDIPMPRMNGLLATREILEKLPQTKVIILSALHLDHQVRDAISFGVQGFMLKSADIRELPAMVRKVMAGGMSFSPQVARYIKQHCGNCKHASGLTRREQQVLQLVGEGNSNKEVAADLEISTKRVDNYVQSLMAKLDVHDRSSLTRYAISTAICESN